MPSASDELRQKMYDMFGDSIYDAGPTNFLKNAGYELRRDWYWEPKEDIACYGDMTQDEYDCLAFLVHEWDFGGLKT